MPVSDLGLSVAPRTQGRAPRAVEASAGRDLIDADIALLAVERNTQAAPIKRLRDSHHQVARLLACGEKPGAVAVMTGYSASRISVLQADPSFTALIETYRQHGDIGFADFQGLAASMRNDALLELRQRMEDTPDTFSEAMLLEIAKILADRTGHGPATKSTNVNVNVDLAARLESSRRRMADADGVSGCSNGSVSGCSTSGVSGHPALAIEGSLQ